MRIHEDELIRMCQRLDRQEADLRGVEMSLRRMRESFRAQVSLGRQHECGLMEGESSQPASAEGGRGAATQGLSDRERCAALTGCSTSAHCDHHKRCLAECVPADLEAADHEPDPVTFVFIHELGEWRCHCGYTSTSWDAFLRHYNAPPRSERPCP